MNKKTLFLIIASLILLLSGGAVIWYYFQQQKENLPLAQTEDTYSLPAIARRQIGVTVGYDPNYVVIDYPGGDVAVETGVCTDVIIRALRHKGIDLQYWVHEDMKNNFKLYPGRKLWKQRATDTSIDHRRVPNLELFFKRIGWSVTDSPTDNPADYLPGDLVTCYDHAHGRPHIMIVSNRLHPETGVPKVIHNSGKGTEENDDLFEFPISGHFRPVYDSPIVLPEPKAKSAKSKKSRQ